MQIATAFNKLLSFLPDSSPRQDAASTRLRVPLSLSQNAVVCVNNMLRTQNGHIRNDTRDVTRRIFTASNGPICRKNGVPRKPPW